MSPNLPIMNLIANPVTIPPAQSALAVAEQASKHALETLRAVCVQTFCSVWHNPNVTPAEMLAAMGTNAAAAFDQHARTVQYLLASGVTLDAADCTPPLAYTIHEDGSITLQGGAQ